MAAPLLRGSDHLSLIAAVACAAAERALRETAVAYCCEPGLDLCRKVLVLDEAFAINLYRAVRRERPQKLLTLAC